MSAPPPRNESLQNYNYELVECIEDLRRKREEVDKQITKEEDDKAKVQKEIVILQDRLQKLNVETFFLDAAFAVICEQNAESLARKIQARNEYDKTIQETEAAYTKILESAQTLLHVLKRESVHLGRKASGIPSDGGLITSNPDESASSSSSSAYEQRARRSHNRAGG